MNTGDAEHSTCEAAEERLAYGTGKSYRSVEHEDRSILPTEVDGTALVMSESSASGYKGVFFAQGHSGSQPYRVEYGGGPGGEVVGKSSGVRMTKHFATNVEAALWYARNVHPVVAQAQARREALAAERATAREEKAKQEAAERTAEREEKAKLAKEKAARAEEEKAKREAAKQEAALAAAVAKAEKAANGKAANEKAAMKAAVKAANAAESEAAQTANVAPRELWSVGVQRVDGTMKSGVKASGSKAGKAENREGSEARGQPKTKQPAAHSEGKLAKAGGAAGKKRAREQEEEQSLEVEPLPAGKKKKKPKAHAPSTPLLLLQPPAADSTKQSTKKRSDAAGRSPAPVPVPAPSAWAASASASAVPAASAASAAAAAPSPHEAALEGMALVGACLKVMHLEQYAAALDALGYDDLAFLAQMSIEQLRRVGEEARLRPGHLLKFADRLQATASPFLAQARR